MCQIAQSFAHLVKSNNGRFKSAAQASFLLGQCANGEFTTTGTAYGKGYTLFYVCDDQGVVKVQKQTVAKGLVTTWERGTVGSVAVQHQKEIARCRRQILALERGIAERQRAWDRGEYPVEALGLFTSTMDRDQTALTEWKQRLDRIVTDCVCLNG